MLKITLILILLFPALNIFHESGHWAGAKLVGGKPQMKLQRVEIEDESKFNFWQTTAYNWGGPLVNYGFMLIAVIYTPLAPLGFVMAVHRLGPNLFAIGLYATGNRKFTNDETKQFSSKYRLIVASVFSIVYLGLALFFLFNWVPGLKFPIVLVLVLGFSVGWLAYLIFLDFLDKKIWLQS